MRMCRIILSSVACLGLRYFSTLCHKRQDFRERKKVSHMKCVMIFSTTFVWNTFHSKQMDRDIIKKKYIGLHVKYPYPCQILLKLEFSRQIFKNTQISWKSVQWEGKYHRGLSCLWRGSLFHFITQPVRRNQQKASSSLHLTYWNGTMKRNVTLWFIIFRYANTRHPYCQNLSHENRRGWTTVPAVWNRRTALDNYTVASRFETRQGHGCRLSLWFSTCCCPADRFENLDEEGRYN